MKLPVVRTAQSNWRIFRWPLVVGLLSVMGLVAALVGNGWLDAASWLFLGSLIVLMTMAYWA
jgi:uncharacterized membrane protein YjjP (DUF1212 family)